MNAVRIPEWLKAMEEGSVPDNPRLLASLTVGSDIWLTPFVSLYLDRFIRGENGTGGSKVKFLISNDGSGGKTHLLRLLVQEGMERGYMAVYVQAADFRLNYVDQLYRAIIQALDLEKVLQAFRSTLIRNLGYEPSMMPPQESFLTWVEEQGERRPLIERTMRLELGRLLDNTRIDRSFSIALISLTAGDLRHGTAWPEPDRRQLLIDWMKARPEVVLSQVKRENIFARITRKNGRRMLSSLAELIRLSGFSGLVACIDGVEELLAPRIDGRTGGKYTKMAREDAYENIRELIDEQDVLQGVLLVFAARRDLIDDEARGVKSYQALWMRIREEVVPEKAFNPYLDLVDLDRLWQFQQKESLVHELWSALHRLCAEEMGPLDLREPDRETMTSVLEINPFNIRQVARILARSVKRQLC